MRLGETNEWVRYRFINGHEALGPFGERLWSNIFRGCGLFYVPFKDLPIVNGKGPRLQGAEENILPDFHVCGMRAAYVDSKCKSGPVLFQKANEWRQGVDLKCWQSYSFISEINRQKCVLAICEIFAVCTAQSDVKDWRGALLMQSLGKLGKPFDSFGAMSDMVLWPRSRFAEIVPGTSPSYLWSLANGDQLPDAELKANVRRVLETPELIQGRLC